jgi:hypothetical protein
MMMGFLAEICGLPELFFNLRLSVRCPHCGNPDAFLTELPETGGAGLACAPCGYRARFEGTPIGSLRAAALRHAAGLCAGGGPADTDEAAAFTERLRREKPGENDEVALVLCLMNEAGEQLRPVARRVEAAVTVPAQRRGELPALYLEALLVSLREALAGVPAGWFTVREYGDTPVKVEALALTVTKCGGNRPPG